MTVLRLALPCAVAAFLAACANPLRLEVTPVALKPAELEAVKQAVAKDLRDPESTRFGPMNVARESKTGQLLVCGWMNSKNAFGGYIGFTPYFARLDQSYDRSVALRYLRLADNMDHTMVVSMHCSAPGLGMPPR